MKPKDWIDKRTKSRSLQAFQGTQINSNQETSPWFLGKINADRTKIKDYFGNEYTLRFTGNPKEVEVALRVSQDTAIVRADEIQFFQVDSSPSLGLVLGRDTTYLYIRYLGQTTKYYFPVAGVLVGQDFSLFLGNLSSNGKGALLGTVTQNLTDNHQIARYVAFTDFQLVPYDDSFTANYTYPIPKGGESYVVLPGTVVENTIDLNENINDLVPFPEPNTTGTSGIWYPYSSIGGAFSSFNPLQNINWSADSGIVDMEDFYGVPCREQFKTYGNQDLVWTPSPNTGLIQNYIFTFNNTTDGQYKADIIFSAINAYLLGLTEVSVQEGVFDQFYTDINNPPFQYPLNRLNKYDEVQFANYAYNYTPNFAYNLRYLESLDVWITEDPVVVTPSNKSWLKSVEHQQNSANPNPGSTFQGECLFDAVTQDFLFRSPAPFYFINAFVYAYATTYTVFPINPIAFVGYESNVRTRSFWNGAVGTTIPFINLLENYWPGFYIYFDPDSPAVYNYMDLNYDYLFIGFGVSDYGCFFAGRTTGVISDLMTQPALYGLATYVMGDGDDHNEIQSKAFRGRVADATAYVYKNTVNNVLRYSSPFLVPGNLTGIQDTGSASFEAQQQDSYVQGVVELIPLRSFADVYDDQVLVAQIDSAINAYWANTVPSAALMNTIYTGLINLTTDLIPSINQVRSALANINAFLEGDPTILGPDVIGFEEPDVFSDRIFSGAGQWPFAVPGTYYLKCPDSLIVQQLYYNEGNEIIQSFNIDETGLISLGKSGASPVINGMDYSVLDFILPIKEEDTLG